MDMTNQPNKANVKDGLPTAEETLHRIWDAFDDAVGRNNVLTPKNKHVLKDIIEEHTALHTQALMERVKELEAQLSEMSEINEEDDIAWSRMKEIRADDYDLGTEREEEIFQFAFFEGIRYIQKALKK